MVLLLLRLIVICLVALLATSCDVTTDPWTAPPVDTSVVHYTYSVVDTFPHDSAARTQGLVYVAGEFIEGTGFFNGATRLRRVSVADGAVLQEQTFNRFFGEGVAVVGNRIYQLSWQREECYVYDLPTFATIDTLFYDSTPPNGGPPDIEGWGLTFDGTHLLMSGGPPGPEPGGSPQIDFRDPDTFAVVRSIYVNDDGTPVSSLNELEFIDGLVYANVFQTTNIVVFRPSDGQVVAWIDLAGLNTLSSPDQYNGIAYDADSDRLFVTGKNWPRLFHIDLVEVEP